MRYSFGLLGGASLALLLFALLAWLVVPPEAPEPLEALTLSLAEPFEPADDAPAEPLASAPEATAPSLPPPPPAAAPPAPVPDTQSAIALPEPELPPLEEPRVELDTALPELVETPPEPAPEPEPKPKPELRPKPVPRPQPAAESAPALSSPSQPAARPAADPAPAAAQGPVDVGSSARPTRRVPPQYPSRAQRRGLEGHVVVQFLIRPDGRVDAGSIEVLEARPRQVFERAARQAIAGWRFEPASDVRRARQRLEFRLR
ncbi:MAG TPA: TonB family protein [Halomonas sp.]|nr:TonB family protein [Halomonas sp.]